MDNQYTFTPTDLIMTKHFQSIPGQQALLLLSEMKPCENIRSNGILAVWCQGFLSIH